MSEDDTDGSRPSSHPAGIVALVIALPLLYALSIGPAVFMFARFPALKPMEGAAASFYAPIIWSCQDNSLAQPLVNYLGWWEKLARR